LLEKVRLIKQSDGERSFHVFYQLVNGLSWAEKKQLGLLSVPDYQYLAKSGCFDRRDGDDGAMLEGTRHAMEVHSIHGCLLCPGYSRPSQLARFTFALCRELVPGYRLHR
jgi:hypothetical protein